MECLIPNASTSTANKIVPLIDANGFLIDLNLWSFELATRIALTRGVSVHAKIQWQVLSKLRFYHNQFNAVPSPRWIYRSVKLAPKSSPLLLGDYLDAWCIAGLPSPGEEAKSYMSGMMI